MADFKDLVDQATDRAIDLRGELKDAGSELEDLLESADKASERASEETEAVNNTIQWLIDRLNQAETGVGKAVAEAGQVLDQVDKRAQAAGQAAGQLVQDVLASLTNLKTRQDALQQETSTRLTDLGSRFAQLTASIGAVSTELGEGQQEASQALAAFGQTLSQAGAQVQLTGEQTTQALASAVTEMGTSADAWVDEMGELLNEQTAAMIGAGNRMLTAHNGGMTRLRTRIGDDLEKKVAPPIAGLVQALQELQDVADSHEKLLTQQASAILERVRQVIPEVQELAQTFRDHSRLE